MSRIGNRIINIPAGVEIKVETNNKVTIKGPKGTLIKQMPTETKINVENDKVSTIRPNDNKINKQLHGTTNSLIFGMIEGVTKGFEKELEINGVGYKAELRGSKLILKVGRSHDDIYEIPSEVKVEVPKPTQIKISGIDKQLVGEVAANIRAFKKPEPYKGKGIKYKEEQIRRKEGKSAGK